MSYSACYLPFTIINSSCTGLTSKGGNNELERQFNEMVLYSILLYRTAPHRTAPHRTAPHSTVLYCIVLHCTVLCCTVLYCTVHPCIILHCASLSQRLSRPSKIRLVTILWSHDTVILLFIQNLVQPCHNIWYTDRQMCQVNGNCAMQSDSSDTLSPIYQSIKAQGVTAQKATK